VAKGARQSFGESPQETLLKRQLGTEEYNRRRMEAKRKIAPKIAPRISYTETSTWDVEAIKKLTQGIWTQEYEWNMGMDLTKTPEVKPETTEDWTEKWARENGQS